jgi:Fe-S oxidoreductase/ActR/RegA family two-component response regulator
MAQQARTHKVEKFLERLPQKLSRQVVTSLVGCVHCGMCTDSCHYVLTNPDDPSFAPAHKADQIRKLFKRHHDWMGRVFPWWVHAETITTDEELEELKDIAFGKCTNCRRCTINCPMGVDFATANRIMRGLLVHVGVMPEGVAVVSKDQWEIGNQMGVLKEDYLDTLEWMSEELVDEVEDETAEIPIDKKGCDVVYSINPREVKYDPRTIADAAKIFWAAGENWTMPSEAWDMTNFGLFSGDDDLGGAVARRLYEKVEELEGKTLVISECGHGYRSTRCEGQNWGGKDINFVMESSVDTMIRYIKEGRIKVDKTRNNIPVTFHDSCNNARSCGLYEEPRELIGLVCNDFREMYPNRAENFCCTGGGGAMSMSEYAPRRLKSAKVKADQITATGAKIVITSCHNCVDGLSDLIKHYKLDVEVTQLVNLVANALIIPEKKEEVPAEAEAPAEEAPFAGKKILVVDDEPDQRLYIATVLEDNGAEVLQAGDYDEAMATAKAEKPDLITLDLGMPGKGGDEIYIDLKYTEGLRETPVCIITGRPELRKTIYDRTVAPPEGYLDKPLSEEKLVLNIRKIFETGHTAKDLN